MTGIDRGTDAPNAPRPENPASAPGRGAILADAPARRECVLAYRVTVDAVLARAAPDPGDRHDGDSHSSDAAATRRPDMADRYPGRYARPPDPPPHVDGPGEHPGHWFNAVNYQGKVLAVDGQGARFQDWPP